MRILISSLVILAIVPAMGNAQAARSEAIPASTVQLAPINRIPAESRIEKKSGPTIESAAVGIRTTVSKDEAVAAQARRRSGVNNDVALMMVGGAAMVVGAIIDGDAGTIFLIGGAVIALWGLYNYLQ